MPVVIAHGQPKSGSTFLYMTAIEIAQRVNNEEFYTFKNRVLGEDLPTYIHELSAEFILDVNNAVGEDKLFIIKTHGKLTEDVEALLAQRTVTAFTSFRDPRDTALSTLNVGEKDRAKGVDRWFAQITDIEQLSRAINTQFEDTMKWVNNPYVLAIPYYITAMAQSAGVGLIADFLNAAYLKNVLAADMDAKRTTLPEFNKGILDRFVEEMSAENIAFANDAWAQSIAAYDAALKHVMAQLGYTMAYNHFTQARDTRLTQRLA